MIKNFSVTHHYVIYSLIQLFLMMAVISIFTSIHFIMGHDFSVTESWLSGNGWYILFIAKILGFFSYLYLYNIQFYKSTKGITTTIMESMEVNRRPFVLSLVGYFIFGYFYVAGNNSIAVNSHYFFFISNIGMSLHFLFDFMFISYFTKENDQLNITRKLILSTLFSLFFFLVTNAHYKIEFVVVLNVLFFFFMGLKTFENYFTFFAVLFLLISPFLILTGADPFLSYDILFRGDRVSIPLWSVIVFILVLHFYNFRSHSGRVPVRRV